MNKPRESDTLKAILQYLASRHLLAFRMQSGALMNPRGRPVRFGTPGMADIIVFPKYKNFTESWFIEVKSGNGKQSELQRCFERQVKEYGLQYFVARSIDDVKRRLDEWQSEKIRHKD